MKWIKGYKFFESKDDNLENICRDILLELVDIGLEVHDSSDYASAFKKLKNVEDENISIYIQRPFGSPNRIIEGTPEPPGGEYPGNIFLWMEIKDTIIRLTEWYYSTDSAKNYYNKSQKYINDERFPKRYRERFGDRNALRFWNSGIEFAVGFNKESDFDGIGDFIAFTSLKILIKK
jgi:hypothetical protein